MEDEIVRSQHRTWFKNATEFNQNLGNIALALPYPGRQLALLIAGPTSRMLGKEAQIAAMMQTEITTFCAEFK